MRKSTIKKALLCTLLTLTYGKTQAGYFPDIYELCPSKLAKAGLYTGLDRPENITLNPSATSNISRKEITAGFASYKNDLTHSFASYAHPTDRGVLTTRLSYLINKDNEYNFTSTLGFAMPIYELAEQRGSAGINAKISGENYSTDKNISFVSDIGAIHQVSDKTNLGISLNNLGGDYTINDESRQFPLTLRALISKNVENVNIAAGYESRLRDSSSLLKFGTEFFISDTWTLRGGYIFNTGEDNITTLGMTTEINNFLLNYGVLFEKNSSVSHSFSAGLKFGKETDPALYGMGETERRYRTAVNYYTEGNLQQARRHFKKVQQEEENYRKTEGYLMQISNALAYLMRHQPSEEEVEGISQLLEKGETFYEEELYDEAKHYYSAVLVLDEDNEMARERISEIEEILAKIADEEERIRKEERIERITRQLESYYDRGMEYFNRGNYTRAKDFYNEGIHFARTNEISDWVIRFNLAIQEANEQLSERHFAEGHRYYQRNMFQEALDEFRKAVQYDPTNSAARSRMEELEERVSRTDENEVEKLYNLGKEAFNNENYSISAEFLKEALEINPNHNPSREILDQIRQLNELEFNEEQFINEGINLYEKENYKEALNVFRKVLQNNPANETAQEYVDNVNDRAEEQYVKGLEAFRNEDYSLAEEKFKDALDLNPEHGEAEKALERIEALTN